MPNYAISETPSVEREALHSENTAHLRRIAEINLQLENLLSRLNGPRPSSVSESGNPAKGPEPCLRDISRQVGKELSQLEQNARFLIDTIG